MTPDLDNDVDPQDLAEAFDEDATGYNEPRSWQDGEGDADIDLPDVYDVVTAAGDRDDEEARIGEEMDDDEIVAAEEDQDGADLEDDDLMRRDAEQFAAKDELEDVADPNGFDPDDLDGVAELGADEVDLEYAGDLTHHAHARSAAQSFESRLLSDEDLDQLDYKDASGPDAIGKEAAMNQPHTETSAETRDTEIKRQHGAPRPDEYTDADPAKSVGAPPRRHQEDLLDEGVEETFPASDPVSVKRIT